jgi:hypothetical protein
MAADITPCIDHFWYKLVCQLNPRESLMEAVMDVKTYCDNAAADLMEWKAKLHDVIRKTEKLGQAGQDHVAPLVKELNDLVDDVDERIKFLAEECPLEWDSHKAGIQEKLSQVNSRWQDLDGAMDVWNMNLERSR